MKFIITVLIILAIFFVYEKRNEIETDGLKSVTNEIWNGKTK